MRKLIVSMNLSLDGYMSGPRGDLDWHFESWNEEMGEKLLDQLDKADTILLGRVTYEAMAKYWSLKPMDQHFPRQDLAIADKMNQYTKIVFTSNGTNVYWKNTRRAGKPFEEEVRQLRKQEGKNMLLLGSGKLVSAFISSGIVDEYQLWIHPVILGGGIRLFNNLKTAANLNLSGSEIFESGVVVLNYRFADKKKLPPLGGNGLRLDKG